MQKYPKRSRAGRSGWTIACFFGVIVGLIFVVDVIIDCGLKRIRTSDFGISNAITQGRINADIVVGGSSRALTHYDSRIIQSRTGRSVFNIGVNGAQTDMQVARIKTYLRHNRRPALLIFNLDLFSFQTSHGGVYDPGQYVPYLDEPAIYEALSRINPNTWKARHWPLYGYAVEDLRFSWIKGVLGFAGWNPVEDHFLGFKPQYSSWSEDFERFKRMNPNGVRFEIESSGRREMEGLLRLCAQRRVPVLLVYSPEYAEMQALTTNRAEVFRQFEKLSQQFDVTFWDYSDSPMSRQRSHFYNSQHLNFTGSSTFSHDLAGRIASNRSLSELSATRIPSVR